MNVPEPSGNNAQLINNNGEYPPDKLMERQHYIDTIVCWYQRGAEDGKLDDVEIRDFLSDQSTIELAKLYLRAQQDTFTLWIRWGSEYLPSASPKQREATIDAIVLHDTGGGYNGTESVSTATAGDCLTEAPLFWARARRERLRRLSGEELAAECRKMLEVESERIARTNHVMCLARLYASNRMRDLVSSRYSYRPSLIEAARYCRQQKVVAKRASALLSRKPLECSNGDVVAFLDDKFIVRRLGQVIATVTEGQFQKGYWPLGKIPPTP